MNRINALFERKQRGIRNIFVTAGYPELHSTVEMVLELEKAGADMVEIGMPFSDPLADGDTIQAASAVALTNGMCIGLLFKQVQAIRTVSQIPIVLMGYVNPVLAFGLENFLTACVEAGVDGLIIPDISLEEYERSYQSIFDKYDVPMTFLFTPRTSLERLMKMNNLTKTFLYFVSSASTTGKAGNFSSAQIQEFKRIQELQLSAAVLMGFGIHDKQTFEIACEHFNGAIVGSAFIRSIDKGQSIPAFMGDLK